MDATRLLAPAGANFGAPAAQPQQAQQQAPQPAPPAPPPQQAAPPPGTAINIAPALLAPAGSTDGYDMSSLDQLQAHALQLSASAGLTNLLLPNPAGHPAAAAAAAQQAQHQAQQQAQQPPNKPQPFIFLQPANAATHQGLPTLAALGAPPPAVQGDPAAAGAAATPSAAPGAPATVGQPQQAAQQFILAAGANPGTAIAAPANLSQQLFAAASGGPATLTIAPNGTLQPQQQSYSSAGIPIPMPVIIPQQQQQPAAVAQQPLHPQQAQQVQQPPQLQALQPLQPAPPALATTADKAAVGAVLAGTKRVHDSSVVSTSTMSLDSGGTGAALNSSNSNNNLLVAGAAPATMNMNDFPEFQLRNKDGSIITEKDLEKMSPAERRRYERNLREQQRSFRISQQIQQLRDVLAESKVPFKPNKYSILVSVADYIKQLQTRAIMLDSEHKKLFKTIQETNEMVASGQIPDANAPSPAAPGQANGGAAGTAGAGGAPATNEQGDLLLVQGLDYQAVFEQTPTANGVASIDGRILACNRELENILECPREQIERQSLFTLVQNHQEIFEAMAELLKRADALSNGSLKADPVQLLYWSGRVVTPDEKKLGMNITLACTKEGSPKFFSFCMSPA